MSLQDKTKWDEKYLDKPRLLLPRDASPNLQKYFSQLSGEYALDLACGNGRNTMYLAENGFRVKAIDIAQIAMDSLESQVKTKGLEGKVDLVCHDLDSYQLHEETFDLIIMSNFLDRDLIQKAKHSLKKGALFFVETYMLDAANEKENSKKSNLLKAEELKEIFKEFEILVYDEFDNEKHELYSMKKQFILARKMNS